MSPIKASRDNPFRLFEDYRACPSAADEMNRLKCHFLFAHDPNRSQQIQQERGDAYSTFSGLSYVLTVKGPNRTTFLSRRLNHRGTESTEAEVAHLSVPSVPLWFFSSARALSARDPKKPLFAHYRTTFLSRRLNHRGTESTEAEGAEAEGAHLSVTSVPLWFFSSARALSARDPKKPLFAHYSEVFKRFCWGFKRFF